MKRSYFYEKAYCFVGYCTLLDLSDDPTNNISDRLT